MKLTKEEFVKKLKKESRDLKSGDLVSWENEYGVKWKHKIIGFDVDGDVYFDNDSWWFPHNIERFKVKKI